MRITDVHNSKSMEFQELRNGDCFSTAGFYWIKVGCVGDTICINAVKLENGSTNYFPLSHPVVWVNAEIVINPMEKKS